MNGGHGPHPAAALPPELRPSRPLSSYPERQFAPARAKVLDHRECRVALHTFLCYDYSFGGGQRPNYDSSAPGFANSPALSGSAVTRLNKWFNTACFSQPAPFSFGNVPRVEPNIRWEGLANFDWALVKNTSFGPEDKLPLQFRAEFFNLFNHPQFGPPGNTFGTPTFGIVSSQYNNPRLIQFALKLVF